MLASAGRMELGYLVAKNKGMSQINPIELQYGMTIGSGSAENDDEYLFDCFINYPPVEEFRRLQSPAMIVAGRTGEGKTAILRQVEHTSDRSAVIDPAEMSMSYVSNSDALRFLTQIGADLDLLFQVLWKHVLCIEFIRLRWDVDSTQKSNNVFQRIYDKFSGDERKKKAIDYLQNWQGKFWITMDENIKEITQSFENKISAEMGAELEKFKAGGQYERRLSEQKKSELVARSRKIINSDQLAKLHQIIEMLSLAENDQLKSHYILIDGLDEKWVDEGIKFQLIRGLLEALKSFRKITNLKILVALRVDILEKVVQDTSNPSFQREKFEDMSLRLRWSKVELKNLVDARIERMFKRKFTSKAVQFDDIFPPQIANKKPFDWMIERTLMRPRDIISFVNEAITVAAGRAEISVTNLRKAEAEYSRKRKDALMQEWQWVFPSLAIALKIFSSAAKPIIDFRALCEEDFVEDVVLQILSDEDAVHDILGIEAQSHDVARAPDRTAFMQLLCSVLYRTGAVGLKLETSEPYIYSHINSPIVSPHVIGEKAKVRLHPMLHSALHLHEK
ncbi:DNA repair ATPase [Sphingomicrobium sp. XHP0239]|uniref:P-loop ATPase, Sll1717 family n=1 Tax=Sphingomicrobium maritimum TaxID=3133972 RepID=UPI0031CCCDFA